MVIYVPVIDVLEELSAVKYLPEMGFLNLYHSGPSETSLIHFCPRPIVSFLASKTTLFPLNVASFIKPKT